MATQGAREALAQSRKDALGIAGDVGVKHVQDVLVKAAGELQKRLAETLAKTKGEQTFTVAHMRAALEQINALLAKLVIPGVRDAVVTSGMTAADASVGNTMQYLGDAHYAFEGMKAQPLPVNEAFMLDAAKSGARASILRRLALSGEAEGVDRSEHAAKGGVLARYGLSVIEHFEQQMQQGIIMKQPIDSMRSKLIEKSPFLQAAPRYWAERIVRTETMNAYNRAGWEAMREADEQLGDMCKILSATFDNRTAADSYAVHGQIRRMEEAFETWYGLMQHPPARPNDREVVVPHRISWPIPKYLTPKTDAEVLSRWHFEKRKGSPPPRPKMTTIPYREFGKPQPLPKQEETEPEKEGPIEQTRPLGYELTAEEQATKAAIEFPERVSLSPEEKAIKNIGVWPEDPDDPGYHVHDFETFDYSGVPPWLAGLTEEESDLITKIIDDGIASFYSAQDVDVDDLMVAGKTVYKDSLVKTIEKVGDGTWKDGGSPIVIKKGGKQYVEFGTQDVLAHSLFGKAKIPVDLLDLDDPDVQAKIKAVTAESAAAKALAEKKAKNAAKAAKAAATKAANKAKKLEAEAAAKFTLPDVDVSAKAIDPGNILHNKYGDQKGSNKGGFYEGKDGVKRYVKEYDDHAQAHGEAISNAIYRALGFDAPESEVFEYNGKLHHAAKLFEGKTLSEAGMTEERAKKALDGFAADVLLANWDVVGMSQDNLFVQPDGKLARIDNGGSLLMRAKAGRKDKTLLHQLTEWDNFFNHKNPSYKALAEKAGVAEADDMRDQAAAGIKKILALQEKHGGWDSFVSKVAPGFKGGDREAIVGMLEARSKKLAEKLPELTKPKPKPEIQVTAPGKLAPPKTKFALLSKAPKPSQTKNETPDGRPLHEYREHIEHEIAKAPYESRSAIGRFTGGSYRSMREAYSRGDKTSSLGSDAHHIPKAFEKAKPVPGEVYRCMGVSHDIAQAYCELPEDEPMHLGPWGGKPAFASASRTQRVSIDGFSNDGPQPILFVINHKRGIGIETISGVRGENEVLMHPNAHFKVTKRFRSMIDGRDFLVLHLDEIDEEEIAKHYIAKGKPVPTVRTHDTP